MDKAFVLGCALAASWVCAPRVAADTVYTSRADWLAAVASRGAVNGLSLTPAAVPDDGGVFVDDEGTLRFPDNHGDMAVLATGWFGDVHTGVPRPDDHEPDENRFSFARPVVAFAATVSFGYDLGPQYDSLLLSLGGGTNHRLMLDDYSPGFFGWIGESAAADLRVASGAGSHFYSMTNVEYVVPPVGAAADSPQAVPEPSAAWGGLVLLVLGAVWQRRPTRDGWGARSAADA